MEFKYKIIDTEGKQIKGTTTADTRDRAAESLRKRGLTVLELVEVKYADTSHFSFEPFGITATAVAFFTQQLASLLEAGIPLIQCCISLRRQTSNRHMQAVLDSLANDMQTGVGIHEAFARHPDAFDPMYLSIIQVAEATGSLPAMIGRLSGYLDKNLEIRRRVTAAMAYPLLVLFFSSLLVYGMVAYLLPGFTPMFAASGLNLARDYPITLFLIRLSSIFRSPASFVVLLIAIVLLAVVVRRWAKLPRLRAWCDAFIYNLPLAGSYVRLAVMARVANSFGSLIGSGMSIVNCIEMVGESANNEVVRTAMTKVSREVQAGNELGSTMENTGVFPQLMLQMVAIGEQAGNLDKMFPRIARYYDDQLSAALTTLTSFIEPLAMVVVGGIVFIFVLGILLPILGIAFSVQHSI